MVGYMCLFGYMGKPPPIRRSDGSTPNLICGAAVGTFHLSQTRAVLLSLHLLVFENIGIHVPMCASAFCRLAQRVCQGPIQLSVPLLHRVT